MAFTSGRLKTSYAADLASFATWPRRFWLLVLIVGLAIFPTVATRFYVNIANLIAIAIIGALALNLLTGFAGLVSAGNAAFMAVGAFSAAALGVQLKLPFPLVLVLCGVISAGVGAIVGIPALQLRGLYLVIGTLALHYIVTYLALQFQVAQVGPRGFLMTDARLGPYPLDTAYQWYPFLVICAALTTIAIVNLRNSRLGRAWLAIRESDIAAEITGIRVSYYKILAFVVSSFFIGVQGALFAYYIGAIQVETFSLDVAIQYVAMIVIGGMGSVIGSILGAIFVVGLPFLVQNLAGQLPPDLPGGKLLMSNLFDIQSIIYGLSIVGFLLFEPRGLVEIWWRIARYFRPWPFSRERLGSGG